MANVTELMKDRLKIIEKEGSSSEDEKNLEELIVDAREKDKWDCQSIISTYSNIYNHPKVISEPKVNYSVVQCNGYIINMCALLFTLLIQINTNFFIYIELKILLDLTFGLVPRFSLILRLIFREYFSSLSRSNTKSTKNGALTRKLD